MRALACWGWLASNRTTLNTSPRPPSTRFRNSCASGGVAASSSRTVGIRAILSSQRIVRAAGYTQADPESVREIWGISGDVPACATLPPAGARVQGNNCRTFPFGVDRRSRLDYPSVFGQIAELALPAPRQ